MRSLNALDAPRSGRGLAALPVHARLPALVALTGLAIVMIWCGATLLSGRWPDHPIGPPALIGTLAPSDAITADAPKAAALPASDDDRAPGAGASESAPGTILCVGPMHHSFGEVQVAPRGTALDHAFVFRNDGDVPATIRGVSTTCGCTAARWPKEPLPPGAIFEVPATLRLEQSGAKPVSVAVAFDDGQVITRHLHAVGRMACEISSVNGIIRPDGDGRAEIALMATTELDAPPPTWATLSDEAGRTGPLSWHPLGGAGSRRMWSARLGVHLSRPHAAAVRIDFEGGASVDLAVDAGSASTQVSPGAVRDDPRPAGPQSSGDAPRRPPSGDTDQRQMIRQAMRRDGLSPLPSEEELARRCAEMKLADASCAIVRTLVEDLRSSLAQLIDTLMDGPLGQRAGEALEDLSSTTWTPAERDQSLAEAVTPLVKAFMDGHASLHSRFIEAGHAALPESEHAAFEELVRAMRRSQRLTGGRDSSGFGVGADLVLFVRQQAKEWPSLKADPGASGPARRDDAAPPSSILQFDPLLGGAEDPAPLSAQALRYSLELDQALQALASAERQAMPRALATMRARGQGAAEDGPPIGSAGSYVAVMMAPVSRARVAIRQIAERHAQALAAQIEASGHPRQALEFLHAWRATSAPRIVKERESPALLMARLTPEGQPAAPRPDGPAPDPGPAGGLAPHLSADCRAAIDATYLDYLRERETLHRAMVEILSRGLVETGLSLPVPGADSRFAHEWDEVQSRRRALADRTTARLLDLAGAESDSALRTWLRVELSQLRVDHDGGI